MIPIAILEMWLVHTPSKESWGISVGISPIYEGFKWLRFHSIHAPKIQGERKMIILGSSNIAGWGDDYRWGARQHVDPWARHSFSEYLQKKFTQEGYQIDVTNLAVNGSRLRSQLFLYLYALRMKPDYIILALSHWTFIQDGDFRDPVPLLQMNTTLSHLLSETDYPNKDKCESALKEYLQKQPHPKVKVTLEPSVSDQLTAYAAVQLKNIYHYIGLPESLVAPTPQPVVNEMLSMEADIRSHSNNDDLKTACIFDEMSTLFPKVLPILKESAAHHGVKLVIMIPPSASRWENWFHGLRKHEVETAGIPTIDLREIVIHSEKETYDGHHFTREGNRLLAEKFFIAMKQNGNLK